MSYVAPLHDTGGVVSLDLTANNGIQVVSGALGIVPCNAGNVVLAGPTTSFGGPGQTAPSFRSLVVADLPSLPASKITSGVFGIASFEVPLAVVDPATDVARSTIFAPAANYVELEVGETDHRFMSLEWQSDEGIGAVQTYGRLFPIEMGCSEFRVEIGSALMFVSDATGSAFNGVTTTVGRRTITGSRGGNAALASLLTFLHDRGDITNSTTA